MYTKTIKYKNFEGKESKKVCYFNLTESEVLDFDYEHEGGLEGYMKAIANSSDNRKVYPLLKDIVLKAYGEISEDGEYLYKSKKISERFACSMAFNAFMISLLQDSTLAAKFVSGTIPSFKEISKKGTYYRVEDDTPYDEIEKEVEKIKKGETGSITKISELNDQD